MIQMCIYVGLNTLIIRTYLFKLYVFINLMKKWNKYIVSLYIWMYVVNSNRVNNYYLLITCNVSFILISYTFLPHPYIIHALMLYINAPVVQISPLPPRAYIQSMNVCKNAGFGHVITILFTFLLCVYLCCDDCWRLDCCSFFHFWLFFCFHFQQFIQKIHIITRLNWFFTLLLHRHVHSLVRV